MTQRQFDLIFEYIKSLSKRVDDLTEKVTKIEYALNHLPEGNLVTERLQSILTKLENEIKSLKDENLA